MNSRYVALQRSSGGDRLRTILHVDPTLQAFLAAVVGAFVAGAAVLAWHVSDRQQHTVPAAPELKPLGVCTCQH